MFGENEGRKGRDRDSERRRESPAEQHEQRYGDYRKQREFHCELYSPNASGLQGMLARGTRLEHF
jgi:hypothetical protein